MTDGAEVNQDEVARRPRRHRRVTRPPQGGEPEPEPTGRPEPPADTDVGWGERRDESAQERWLREQRPPHWG